VPALIEVADAKAAMPSRLERARLESDLAAIARTT
jgi:hypothetical protein